MKEYFTKKRTVLLGVLGIVFLTLIVGGGIFLAGYISRSPADLLPEKETVALFAGISKSDQERFTREFPSLGSFPDTDAASTIAFLALPNHSTGWVTFSPRPTSVSSFWQRFSSEKYAMTYSSSNVASLLQEKTPRLSASPDYASLITHAPSAPLAFIDLRLLGTGSGKMLLQTLTASPFAAIHWTASSMQISFLSPSNSSATLSAPLTHSLTLDPAAQFFVASASPSTLLASWMHLLSPTQQIVSEGRLRREWRDLFGDNASFAYDFPPLLASPGSLSVTDGTGSLKYRFLLQTSATKETLAAVADLHQSMSSLLQPFSIKERELTHGYSAKTIEEDPSLLSHTTQTVGDWTLEATQKKGVSAGIFSARNDEHLLLSNDASWLAQAVTALRTPPSDVESNLSAMGLLPPTTVLHLKETFPILDTLMRTFGLPEGALSFSVEHAGNIVTLDMSQESGNRK